MIERIRIRNFRSLHDVDVRLEPLTVLIGRSGSGKSNFVQAVRILRDLLAGQTDRNHLGSYLSRAIPFGTKERPSYELTTAIRGVGKLHYSVSLGSYPSGAVKEEKLVRNDQTIFHQQAGKWITEPDIIPRPAPGGLLLGALTGVREATITNVAVTRGIGCYDFTGTVLQGGSPLEKAPGYSGTGGTAVQVAGRLVDSLDHLEDWSAIGKSLRAVNQRLRSLDLLLPARNQLRAGFEVTNGKTLLVDVAEESEGFRRYLAHLLALYQTPSKQTLLFEHPESGIHPGALEALFGEFKSHVDDNRGQVILTTHSPQFLDRFEPQQIRVVELKDGQTRIGSLAEDQAHVIRDRLMTAGELLTVDEGRIDPPAALPVGAV